MTETVPFLNVVSCEMAVALGKRSADAETWKVYEGRPMSGYEYYSHDELTPGKAPRES